MFAAILRFELRQQLRSPLFWMIALAFAALAFAAAGSDQIRIGGGVGNIHRNAPYVVLQFLDFFTVLGLFLITVFVAGAALRDFDAGTAELFFSTPMSRGAYLGGRFAAGWLMSIAVLAAVALGLLLGVLMPWVDSARLGPTPWAAYGYAFAVVVLPNLFFIGALLFLLATLTRSMLGTYVGVIAFFVLWQIALLTLGNGNLEHRTLGALIDPFAIASIDLATRYWTAADRNVRLPELAGVLLGNRALWLAVGALLLGLAFALFRPDREGLRLWRRRRAPAAIPEPRHSPASLVLPAACLHAGPRARLAQFAKLAWFDTRGVLRGVAFLVMLALGLMNLGANLAFSGEIYGTGVYPVTHLMTRAMQQSFNFLLLIVVGFYAGELVWRERSGRISEVTDAFPLPDWIPLLAKIVALAAVIVLFLLAGSLACVVYQTWRGFRHIEPALYLANIALTALPFLLIGALAVVLQVLANNKFLGYLLFVLFIVSRIVLAQLHFDHNLYSFGAAPNLPYSDMNGYGTYWIGVLWFRAYWGCLALALLVLAALYWVRGTASGWRERARIAKQRFRVPARTLLAASLLGFVALGGWIYHNTNVLNRYQPEDAADRLQADYEKAYRKYRDLPQPRITDVHADVAIFPGQRRVEVNGRYTLVNKHAAPIDELLVQLPTPDTRDFSADLDFPAHTLLKADPQQGFYLYKLAAPLAPGASMPLGFREHLAYRGFANAATGTELVGNGTFFDSYSFPHFCYDDNRQLTDPNKRRKYGLGPVPRMAKRDDAPAHANNLISCDADWVHFDATVSTSADQIALAPGYLQKEWNEGDRRYFHYVQDTPILDFFSFQSARYAVRRDRWHDVAIEIYYDPRHPYNVERMVDAARLSLDYYTQNFGPYQFRQVRILEFPDYRRFAQSFANTIPFSESIGFIADLRKPEDIDYVTYVTAHEIGHQWWGHQAIGASVQGVTMLDESLAQYSALMVMKHKYGELKMRKFLKYELDRYLSDRAAERVEEEPLALVENQAYIHYRKGSVIFYALQDYVGEGKVNAALRTWLGRVRFQQPPYTDTRDLLADLRAGAGPQYAALLVDFFDRITLYDNRMIAASAKKLADGRYEVTLKLHAAKSYADGKGAETPAKMDIPVDIGVFARAADGEEQDERPLHLQKQLVADGDSTVTLVVDGKPYEAGIDPYNKLVDRVSDDNRMRVDLR